MTEELEETGKIAVEFPSSDLADRASMSTHAKPFVELESFDNGSSRFQLVSKDNIHISHHLTVRKR